DLDSPSSGSAMYAFAVPDGKYHSSSGRGLLRDVGARCFHIDGIKGFACGHEQPVALGTAETGVGAGFWQTDHSDAIAVRRNDLNSRTGSSPDVAVHVTANAIGGGWLPS